jgi:hypothetical protein
MQKHTINTPTITRIFVLCTVILSHNLIPAEFSTPFIILLGAATMVIGKIQRGYLQLVWPLLIVFGIGLMGTYGHEWRDIFRDISYALMPITLLYLGFWIARDQSIWQLFLKVMLFLGFILALNHLSTFILDPSILSGDSIEIRNQGGSTSEVVILAFVFGLFHKRLCLTNIYPKYLPSYIIMPILLASTVLSFSRTGTMMLVLLSLSMLGYLTKINHRFFLVIVLSIIAYMTLFLITPENEENTYRSKLLRSAQEVTISDFSDMRDINSNWRGFEAYRAVETYLTGNVLHQVVGQGFGALIDLEINIQLGGEDAKTYSYIPITHNGYVYILIKTGAIGLICYTIFYFNLIVLARKYNNAINPKNVYISRLLMGCALSMMGVMYVVGGIAEIHSAESVLVVGFIKRYIEHKQIKNNQGKIEKNINSIPTGEINTTA